MSEYKEKKEEPTLPGLMGLADPGLLCVQPLPVNGPQRKSVCFGYANRLWSKRLGSELRLCPILALYLWVLMCKMGVTIIPTA